VNLSPEESPFAPKDHYYVGGILFAAGSFSFALAKPALGQTTWLPFLGRFTSGVYVSHMLIIYAFAPVLSQVQSLVIHMGFAAAVYLLALCFTMVLVQLPIAKCLVVRD
jgi:hypothetical protein